MGAITGREAKLDRDISESSVAEYREAVKKLIEKEIQDVIDEETRKAAQELLEEQRKAIRQMLDEHRAAIREAVEEEKKAIEKSS